MKRKTILDTISVYLMEHFSPLNAVEALKRLNTTLNEKILPVAVNPDQIELTFTYDDSYTTEAAHFDFERWETDEEFDTRKNDAKAKRNATRLKNNKPKKLNGLNMKG